MLSALEQFAPLPLQEDWDNAGLQIGLTEAEVSGALLCLDVTEAVVTEAVDRQCNLIVSHHPLLFRGLKRISGSSDVERAVMKAISHGIAIISMHTNMDNAWGGVNCKIAEKIGLQQVQLFACKQVGNVQGGSGVTGLLPQPMDAEAFIAHFMYEEDLFPLAQGENKPLREYLQILCEVKILLAHENDQYEKLEEIEYFQHIEEAVKGDDELLRKFMYN